MVTACHQCRLQARHMGAHSNKLLSTLQAGHTAKPITGHHSQKLKEAAKALKRPAPEPQQGRTRQGVDPACVDLWGVSEAQPGAGVCQAMHLSGVTFQTKAA